jgi:pilus assembly protein FimV
MNRNWVTLLASALCALPATAFALGLGEIDVRSSLNEPLDAHIPLEAVQDGDLDGMRVSLGTTAQFQRAGIERPFTLSALRFRVVETGADTPHLALTTAEPVVEPFLNFLVEVNWPRGRVIREYTILLDPPVYGAAISTTVRQAVATVPSAQQPVTPAPTPPAPSVVQAPQPAPAARPAPRAARGSVSAPGSSIAATGESSTYGPVGETDTLWSISERFRPDSSVSVQRMMLVILEANPEAFSIHNVNALRAGAVLRIPARSEIGSDDRAATLREVQRQYAEWDEYRQSLSSRVAASPPAAPATSAGAPMADAGSAAGATAPAPDEVSRLEVLAGGTAETGAATPAEGAAADVSALRDELQLAMEEAEATRRETDELSSRLSEAEQLISDLQRLVELKDDSIAALQSQLAQAEAEEAAPEVVAAATPPMPGAAEEPPAGGTEPPAEPPVEEPVTTATEAQEQPTEQMATTAATEPPRAEQQPEPKATPRPAPPPPAPPPSTLDMLRSSLPVDPVILGAGLGGVLVLGGGLALMRRRKRASEEAAMGEPAAIADGESMIAHYAGTDDEAIEVTEVPQDLTELPADATEMPATDSTVDVETREADSAALQGVGTIIDDTPGEQAVTEEDPLAEVNVYLAYERYEQAEELVRNAIEKHPTRPQYRTRLLEVLFAAGNVAAFQAAAHELRDAEGEGSDELQSATVMWNELAPGQDLFGPGAAAASSEGDGVFDVTADDRGAGTVDEALAGDGSGLDFDLGFESEATTPTGESTESGLDFDLGFGAQEGDEVQAGQGAGEGSGVDFDLGFEEEAADAASSVDGTGTGSGSGVDFDLGFDDQADAAAEHE